MDEKVLAKVLESTHSGENVMKLMAMYEELDKAQIRFSARLHLTCPEGCGSCCLHYRPSLTEAEAEEAAYQVLLQDKAEEVLRKLEEGRDTESCPLFLPDNPWHCSLYAGRSLVCRLFGNSATLDKKGEPTMKSCRWNPEKRDYHKEDLEGEDLVLMPHYGEKLQECNDRGSDSEDISTSLSKAILKLQFLSSLVGGEEAS